MDRNPHESDTPEERPTRLANVAANALEGDPEYDDDVRAMIFVYPNTGRGGICAHNYEGDTDRMVSDVLQSLDAILQTRGKSLRALMSGGQG